MKIAVIGTGYVGLVTGTCLAESGNDVVCVDKVAAKIARLEAGRGPDLRAGPGRAGPPQPPRRPAHVHHRPGRGDRRGRARLHRRRHAPGRRRRRRPRAASGPSAEEIAEHLDAPKIIVIKSTVPVGTNAELARRMAEVTDVPFDVASNPEFLKEGAAIDDFNKPDRVVVGVRRPEVGERLRELYAPFLRTDRPFLVMSPEIGRDDQVRGQLPARHQDQLHQRDGQPLRGVRRRHQRRPPGHRPRPADRLQLPLPGRRLRRQSCFPKDIRAVDPHGPGRAACRRG